MRRLSGTHSGLGLGSGWGFTELSRRYGDFAIVLAAVMIDVGPDGTISRVRIAVGSVADCPVRCAEAEAALLGKPGGPGAFQVAAAAAASPLDPPSDVHGSSAYRRHLVKVLVERALSEAWQRVTGEPRSG